jgi:septum site-determining protein MinC
MTEPLHAPLPLATIKGTKDGLVITLGEGPVDAVLQELQARLGARASFFLGGRAALRAGDLVLSVEQLEAIGALLEEVGMTLWAVESEQPATHVAARALGLETGLRAAAAPAPAPSGQEPLSRTELPGIVVRRTLRAGQELHYAGHVTLIGDVNPGAEVVAGGDLVVWGKLRGRAHAGALGDDGAVVCALQLAPGQIRIGQYIAQPPERARLPKHPEIAVVQDGRIVVERWER